MSPSRLSSSSEKAPAYTMLWTRSVEYASSPPVPQPANSNSPMAAARASIQNFFTNGSSLNFRPAEQPHPEGSGAGVHPDGHTDLIGIF